MNEPRFPSGPWTGFYNYVAGGPRHRMDLHLTFAGGKVNGEGIDDIGRFLIRGGYDDGNGECYWTKRYLGAHDVFYRGFREGKGIWGTWELMPAGEGGFHIWPRTAGVGDEETEKEELSEPVVAVSVTQAGV